MENIIQLANSLWGLILIVVFFGGSIVIHEFGHYIAAVKQGLKVERFSIGFGPKLFSWKSKKGVIFQISLLPLGGYVALPQIGGQEELEGTFKSKNLPEASYLSKIITVAAGPFFNILFALFIASILWIIGIPENSLSSSKTIGFIPEQIPSYLPNQNKTYESPAYNSGLQMGDVILKVDNNKVNNFVDVTELIALGTRKNNENLAVCTISILRNNEEKIDFDINPILVETNPKTKDAIRMIGIYPGYDILVGQVTKESPAEKAGLKQGDKIISINDEKVYNISRVSQILESKNEAVKFEILRNNNQTIFLKITPEQILLSRPLEIISLGTSKNAPVIEIVKDDNNQMFVFNASLKDVRLENIKIGEKIISYNKEKIVFENHTIKFDLPKEEIIISEKKPLDKKVVGFVLSTNPSLVYPSPIEQFTQALLRTKRTLFALFAPESDIGINHLSGPIGIGRLIYTTGTNDIRVLLSFIVLLNLNLAILNLLPLPVLDGGHIVLFTIEKLRGKKLPKDLMMTIQSLFMLAFLGLMVYIIFFDSLRWAGDAESSSNIDEKVLELYYTPKK